MAIVRKRTADQITVLPVSSVGNPETQVFNQIKKSGLYYFPLPIEKIISRIYGIKIISDPDMDKDVSGYIAYMPLSGWCIGINQYHSSRRQRFTLAHELAHYILHQDIIKREGRHNDEILLRDESTADIEMEANNFAGRLMVPEDKLLEAMKSGQKTVDDLAEVFDVSIAAIRYRAYQLRLLRRV